MMCRFIKIFIISISSLLLQSTASAIEVSSSFSIISDLIYAVGGDKVQIHTIVPAGKDMHSFQLSPTDIVQLQKSKILFINGLGFEPAIEKAAKNQKNLKVVVVSTGVQALSSQEAHHEHNENRPDAHKPLQVQAPQEKAVWLCGPPDNHKLVQLVQDQAVDPHAWQNPKNVIVYIENIQRALSTADSKNAAYYQQRASAYKQQLQALSKEVNTLFQKIPANKRNLMTSHQAFDYFAEAFQLHFHGVRGINPHGQDISAQQLKATIALIRQHNIQAIFYENIGDKKLAETISRNANIRLGGQLFSDTLAPQVGINTYLDLIRKNAQTVVKVLQ